MGSHMPLPRAALESLLRARHLDRTLTTALPPIEAEDPEAVAPTDIAALDARLGGGFPRGQLSELVGPRSSGRMSLLLRMAAAATARGELVAFVDVLDMLDVESAVAAGVDLSRLMWIRGHASASPGACRDTNQRAVEQALRALALVLQAGGFGLAIFEAGEAPADALRRLPFTTWLRVQRMVEGADTACVLVASETTARSAAGLTLRLGRAVPHEPVAAPRGVAAHARFAGGLFDGITVDTRVVRARALQHEQPVTLVTAAVGRA